jgi:hypothetical protein
MDRVYESRDHSWLSVHGELMTMGRHGRSGAREVIVIAQRERGGRQGSCDRTTSEMRGLSPKIILGDSRRRENAQTHTYKHTVPNIKFKLKLL